MVEETSRGGGLEKRTPCLTPLPGGIWEKEGGLEGGGLKGFSTARGLP